MFHVEQTKKFISKSDLGIGLTTPFSRLSASFIMMACGFNRINDLLSDYVENDATEVVSEILKRIDVAVNVIDGDLINIPKTGGFLAISNYPHGLLDLLIMANVIKKVRPDARFLFKNELFDAPFIHDLALISSKEPISDSTMVRKALDHIKDGRPLIVFPAQESASYSRGFSRVVDNPWNQSVFKIARLANVPMLSFYISGKNTGFYLTLRKLSNAISSALIVRELLATQFSDITVAISELFSYNDVTGKVFSDRLKTSQKDAVVASYSRALTFIQEQKLDASLPVSFVNESMQRIEIEGKVLLHEKNGYKVHVNNDHTIILYQKDGKNVLSFSIATVKKGRYAESNWFSNFDMSRSTSALVERDAVEIFNISYSPDWNYNDVEFIAESFKYIAKLFGVQNIIIQDPYKYYYSQSTAYALHNHLLDKNYSQIIRNRVVVPRSPSPSLKPISRRMAREVLGFPDIAIFRSEIKKMLQFQISPLISAITLIGGKYISSATPSGRNTHNSALRDEKIPDPTLHNNTEALSHGVNLLLIRL